MKEKRRILDFLFSNCLWKDDTLIPNYRKPFDTLAVTNAAHPKEKATSRMKSGLSEIWLPGRDSNPRPIGYKCPDISARLGLSHHPPMRMSGAIEVYWVGSSTSSLCTFLSTHSPSTGFAQDYRREKWDSLLRLP